MSWSQRGEQRGGAENGGAMREGVDLENDWHTINDSVFRNVILRQFISFFMKADLNQEELFVPCIVLIYALYLF